MDDVTKAEKVLRRTDGRVGYVIFNNPERHNAVSLEMWAATSAILDDYARDDEVRVVVLTGAGMPRLKRPIPAYRTFPSPPSQ
jgi:enoyl-CoA hydratase